MEYEGRVDCEYCLKNLPKEDAFEPPEATEYVLYFCGLECYDTWHKHREEAEKPESKSKK